MEERRGVVAGAKSGGGQSRGGGCRAGAEWGEAEAGERPALVKRKGEREPGERVLSLWRGQEAKTDDASRFPL